MRVQNHIAQVSATPSDAYLRKLLERITQGKTLMRLRKGQHVFSQGDAADAIYFMESGRVKITVVSTSGKEAVLALRNPRDFFGEGCLIGQTVRGNTATALESSAIIGVEKQVMLGALRHEHQLCEVFAYALLRRNSHLEEDLCDQLFNDSERRLARVLLKLAELNQDSAGTDVSLPKVNHEVLAEMIGTTRSRVTHFMNKFRKLGIIDYDSDLTLRPRLIRQILLRD
jgi:CRP-like cAMP-binding protein